MRDHLLLRDLREVHDRLSLLALVAAHQVPASISVDGHQTPAFDREHPIGPRRQAGDCG